MNWFRQLFNRTRKARPARPATPPPPGWKFTTEDLMAEMHAGTRPKISGDELAWAREYERSLIPEGTRFPRKGDVYESLEDQTVDYRTEWAAPYEGGAQTTLFKGERVRVNWVPDEAKPVGVSTVPVEYKKLEERIVPRQERESSKYGGFYFYFTTIELNTKFKLVKARS